MTCQCKICVRHREYDEIMSTLDSLRKYSSGATQCAQLDRVVKFIEETYSSLNHIEMDNDWRRAIIAGTWPSADEQIECAREKSNKQEVIVDKHWTSKTVPREKIREMIDQYALSQPSGTLISGDYLDHVLNETWKAYLGKRNG